MSYTPTNWVTGDVITADKLNNIEQGIVNAGGGSGGGGNVLMATITETDGNYSCDKTFSECSNALNSGGYVVFKCAVPDTEQTAFMVTSLLSNEDTLIIYGDQTLLYPGEGVFTIEHYRLYYNAEQNINFQHESFVVQTSN